MSSGLLQKLCPQCGILKPIGDFPKNKARPDGCGYYCKACFAARYRAHRERKAAAEGRTLRPRRAVPDGFKYCPDCKAILRVSDFGRNRSARDGLTSYCKPCHNRRGKATYTRLYGSTREYHLRRRYGIGPADVDRMLAEQGGECAVCGKPDPEHIDHDHATGQVRGMLCFNCNQALGNVRDDATVLQGLIDYLAQSAGDDISAAIEDRLRFLFPHYRSA